MHNASYPFKPLPMAKRMLAGCYFGYTTIVGTSTKLPGCIGKVTMYLDAIQKEVIICDGQNERTCFVAKLVAFMGDSRSIPNHEKILVLIGSTWHAVLYTKAGTWAAAEQAGVIEVIARNQAIRLMSVI